MRYMYLRICIGGALQIRRGGKSILGPPTPFAATRLKRKNRECILKGIRIQLKAIYLLKKRKERKSRLFTFY